MALSQTSYHRFIKGVKAGQKTLCRFDGNIICIFCIIDGSIICIICELAPSSSHQASSSSNINHKAKPGLYISYTTQKY